MNRIWCGLIIVGIFVSVITGTINNIGNIMIDSSMKAFNIFLQTSVLILFWGGLFQIAIDSGMVKRFSQYLKKPLSKIYKELDTDSYAYELICSNMVANILGLGNAATPCGLKAMEKLQEENSDKYTLSDEMLIFILINTASIQLIPTTIISIRNGMHSNNPTSIVPGVWFSSIIAFISMLVITKVYIKVRGKCK